MQEFASERGRVTGPLREARASGRSTRTDARFSVNRVGGARPERSSSLVAGGVLSPRSGRRSPIRVLPGGQAARS